MKTFIIVSAILAFGLSVPSVNGQQQVELIAQTGHPSNARSIAINNSSSIFATGSNGEVKLWDLLTKRPLRTISSPEFDGQVLVTFNPEGNLITINSKPNKYDENGNILEESDGNVVKVWDVISGREINTLDKALELISYSQDGRISATYKNEEIKVRKVLSQEIIFNITKHLSFPSLPISNNGENLAFIYDNKIELWNLNTKLKVREINFPDNNTITCMTFSSDDNSLGIGTSDGNFILNLRTGQKIKIPDSDDFPIYSMTFSLDGKYLISVSSNYNNLVDIWELKNNLKRISLKDTTSVNVALAFRKDGKFLAVSDIHAKIRIFDIQKGQVKILEDDQRVVTLIFSPDGTILGSAGNYGSGIKLWNLKTGKDVKYTKLPEWAASLSYLEQRWDVANINGQEISASPQKERTIKLLRTINKKEVEIASIMFAGDNDWLITTPNGLFDGTPLAWKQLIWRFNNNTFDYSPVESFFKEFYRPGLLQDIFAGNPVEPPAQDLSKIDIRQPSVKIAAIDEKPTASAIESLKQTVKVKIEITDNVEKGRRDFPEKSSGANDVRLFRNGSLVRIWRNNAFELTGKDGCQQFAATKENPRKAVCEIDVPIIAGKNDLTAYVFNSANVKSNDATAQIEGKFPKREGMLYVLAIGVNDYAPIGKSRLDLNFAVPDVVDIGNAIKREQSNLAQDAKLKQYGKTEVITLKDETATRANILLALNLFAADAKANLPENLCAKLTDNLCAELKTELAKIKPTEPEDALVIYYAGHGTSKGQRFYLLPHDFTGEGGEDSLATQAVSDEELNDLLERVDAGRLLMVIDACQSGQALGAKDEGRAPMNSKGLAQLAYDKGMLILTATQSQEAALEAVRIGDKEIRHGLLSYALLEAMKSAEADKDTNKQLWEREWLDYAVGQVPLLQREAMRQRHAEIKSDSTAEKKRSEIVYLDSDNPNAKPDDRSVQTPRVFYRREVETIPLVIAKP